MDLKLGGCLRFFRPFWHTFCKDRYVLGLLKGIKIPFKGGKPPYQVKEQPELNMSDAEKEFVDSHLNELLRDGCIKKLEGPIPNSWISNIFLVPKPNGKFRMILNLKKLNEHVVYTKFQLNQIQKVLDMVRRLDFCCSLDLISAFSHLNVDSRFHRYFQFWWRGQYYCFCTMPQGFTDSPQLFVRLTSPVMAHLHKHMIDILIYINDTFLRAESPEILQRNIETTIDWLTKCGFLINFEKFSLVPSHQMEFLGFLIDTVAYTVSVTKKKRDNLDCLVKKVLKEPSRPITIRYLAKIIGKIVAFFPASDDAKLNYRTLERFKIKALKTSKSWSKRVVLSPACIHQLDWWSNNIYSESALTKSLETPQPSQVIFTDSSGYGYGSIWNGEEHQGLFTEKQKKLSINSKELLAIYFTLGAYAHRLSNEHIMLSCDNYTAIYCIVHRGSKDSFRDYVTSRIFELAKKWKFTLQISYVKSKENSSDRMFRNFSQFNMQTEWELDPQDFKKLEEWWTCTPELDLFASDLNCKLPKFMSWKPCINSLHIDAFTVSWTNIKGFLFPPFSLISRTIKKMYDDQVENICGIFPLWQTKSWWPSLMRLIQGPVKILPKEAVSRLRLPWDHSLKHPMKSQLHLIFVNLSIQSLRKRTCPLLSKNTLPKMHGGKAHKQA